MPDHDQPKKPPLHAIGIDAVGRAVMSAAVKINKLGALSFARRIDDAGLAVRDFAQRAAMNAAEKAADDALVAKARRKQAEFGKRLDDVLAKLTADERALVFERWGGEKTGIDPRRAEWMLRMAAARLTEEERDVVHLHAYAPDAYRPEDPDDADVCDETDDEASRPPGP